MIEISPEDLWFEFELHNKNKTKFVNKEKISEWVEILKSNLNKEEIDFEIFDHQGKSPHILVKLNKQASQIEKEAVMKYFIPLESSEFADWSLCGKHLIAVPYAKHWRHGTYKKLIEKTIGNKINIDDEKFKKLQQPKQENKEIKRISNNITARIVSVVKISELASEYGLRKGSNNWYCPFHKDENASLSLNDEKGFFHCFGNGCNAKGNIVDFVAQINQIDKKQAIYLLRKKMIKFFLDNNYDKFCEEIRWLYQSCIRKYVKDGEGFIVEYLLKNFHFITFKDNASVYVYNEGIYEEVGEVTIAEQVQKILEKENSNHSVNEIIGHIKRKTYRSRESLEAPLNLLCLKNGIFDIKTRQLLEFSFNYFFLNKIPVIYDPSKDCPKIKKFLKEVIIPREDWNKENVDLTDILTIQEFTGFLFYRHYFLNKAVMLYGAGQNGKSTFINLIKKFLGDKNFASVPIQKLETDKFSVSSLYGKLANLFADLPKKALAETSMFKTLTGGDSVDAEKKFKDSFNYENYAKMIFSANSLPLTDDDTIAFWRRWIMFDFSNSFPEKDSETNKNLVNELTTPDEISGFFNWALEGLQRIIQNQKFTLNKSTTEIREEYIRRSDSIGAFILDKIEENPNLYEIKRDIYESYASYCRDNGYELLAENAFHRKFHNKVNVREIQPETGKKAWKGVKLRDSPLLPEIGAEGLIPLDIEEQEVLI
jgi:putative DNA primase/helicase